jgi:anti-sigma factor RsiW
MKCKELRALLDDFILGELDAEIEIQVNEHLAECDRCKRELDGHSRVLTVLKNTRRFEPSAALTKQIKRRVFRPRQQKYVFNHVPKSLAFALATFVLGMVLMRSLDVWFFKQKTEAAVEFRYEQKEPEPFNDTLEFYHVPAKHMARI